MRRREFIAGLGGAAAWPLVAQAQQASIPLVGFLTSAGAAANARYLDAFRSGMLELGYVEGSNIRYEYRFADGHLDRLPELAVDLVRIKPNVIVSAPLPTHMALRQATSTIPIVMATGADPVGFGLVTSLSHPGGNVTGLTNFAEVLAAKQVDLLRELIPRLSRLGALVNVTNPLHVPQLQETKAAAVTNGIDLMPVEIRYPATSWVRRLKRWQKNVLKLWPCRPIRYSAISVGVLLSWQQLHECLRSTAFGSMSKTAD